MSDTAFRGVGYIRDTREVVTRNPRAVERRTGHRWYERVGGGAEWSAPVVRRPRPKVTRRPRTFTPAELALADLAATLCQRIAAEATPETWNNGQD